MLIQCDCDSRAFAPNGVWLQNHNPSHGSVSRDSPRVSCHVTSLSGRPVLLLRPIDVDCAILLASTAVAVTILDKRKKSVKGDGCEADLKEKLCWFYRCQFPRLMETQPFMKGPQREATSREQPSSDVKRSIMQYVFLADSVPRELADKIGSRDKLCGRIIHVHWVMNSMWLVRCQQLSLSPHLLALSL